VANDGFAAPSEFEFLRVTVEQDAVVVVRLDRPPVNAVNQTMYGNIRDLFGRFDELCPSARVVVLTSEHRHFCAGNDLAEFATLTSTNSPGRMRLVRDAFAALYDCPVPVIAAVNGSALGTGTALAACSDVVVCGESARFGTPEVGVGVMGGAKHLRRLVPEHLMRLMYFTADSMSARDLLPYGGIAQVVPDDELQPTARALAQRIARHSASALRHAKESLNAIEPMALKDGYEAEQRVTARLAAHPDSLEARLALLEKRPASYVNR